MLPSLATQLPIEVNCGLQFPLKTSGIKHEISEEITSMMNLVLNALTRLHKDEEGQGLVEYLLILALVAFACTAGMGSLASYLNQSFSSMGSLINKYVA